MIMGDILGVDSPVVAGLTIPDANCSNTDEFEFYNKKKDENEDLIIDDISTLTPKLSIKRKAMFEGKQILKLYILNF
ncbi:unnamed protein product [Meloidogyne enterolobii]